MISGMGMKGIGLSEDDRQQADARPDRGAQGSPEHLRGAELVDRQW
jgi:hypothetical protein